MNIVSRSPKTWPYAQSSAQDSVGKLLGTLHPGLLGDILCWEAKGEARRLFESDLKKTILEYLIEHSDKAQESGSYLSIPLFMVGKRAKRAKPVVMFVSDDKVARKEAYDLIIKSDIMTKYPGFELGHSDFEKLMAWADETVFAFTAQREDASDCCQLAYRPSSDSEKPLRLATAGGVVSYGRRHMLLTVSHFLKDPPTIELPVHIAEANQISDCEITGLGDFDDDDDDDTDTEFVETVRQGSISDVDESKESEIGDSDTPISASESDGNSQRRSPISPQESFLSERRLVGKVSPVLCEESLDYALFEVDIISPSAALFNNAISLTDLDKVESGPRKTDVKAMTSNGDTVRGVMSEDTLTVRLPQFTEFVEVYTARFFGSLGPGDCGSWVRDEVTGRLFGHVFAGNLPNGLTAIMPAKLVFEHARTQLDQQFPLVESLESDQELENLVLQSVEDDHDSTYGSAKPSMTKISQHLPNIIPGIFGPGNDKEPTQSKPIKKYVCRDPATAGLYSELKPDYPLSRCRACSSKKKYGAYYNAAAHLRRIHFRQRRPLGISGHMNKSRGKTNGNWPLMSQLRLWFEEVEADESPGSIGADNDTPVEDFLSTNEYLPDSNTDPSAPSFHPLKDRILSNSSKETVGLLAPLPQSLNTSPLGFSFSPNSLSTMTPSSSSDSPYQLINVNSHVSPSQSWDIDFLYFLNETGALSTFITEVSSLAPSSLVKADMKGPSTSTIAKSPVTASTPGALPEVSDDDFALYNNQHINPQYSYTQLITQAILNAPNGELDIDGIFTFIKNSHPYYRLLHEADGWQNFVRLRLQLDNSFEEVAGSTKEPMKEMKWHIVPERRGELARSAYEIDRRDPLMATYQPLLEPWASSSVPSTGYAPEISVASGSSYDTCFTPLVSPSLVPFVGFDSVQGAYFSPLTSPALTSTNLSSVPVTEMNIDEDSPTVAPITKPRKATASHSSGRSNSYQRRKASRVFCTVCNDHPDGFRGPHELDRHMLRHDDQKISKTFICRDPASVGIRSDVQAINPLFKCEPCLAQKQYTSLNRAIAHLYLRHIRDPATGKSHTGDSGTPLTEKLKDWCCEVRVGKHGRVVPEAGGTSADTNGGSSDMECDDKEDTVMNSDIPESSSSTQTVDDSSDIHQIICSNCSTQSSLGLYSQSLAEKPLCMDCSNLTTSHGSAQPSYPKAVDLSSTSAAARNPQSSNTENNEHAIREPFSVVTDTVKDSLLFLPAQREWDHVWNRDGPGIEGGYSQTTTTTSATGLHTIGSESTNDTNNIIINEQHSTTAKQEFATRLASIFDRTPAANNTSTTISLTVEGSHSSMDASYYKADPSSYGTANAPIVDCEIAHMGHWDEDQINNLSKK